MYVNPQKDYYILEFFIIPSPRSLIKTRFFLTFSFPLQQYYSHQQSFNATRSAILKAESLCICMWQMNKCKRFSIMKCFLQRNQANQDIKVNDYEGLFSLRHHGDKPPPYLTTVSQLQLLCNIFTNRKPIQAPFSSKPVAS